MTEPRRVTIEGPSPFNAVDVARYNVTPKLFHSQYEPLKFKIVSWDNGDEYTAPEPKRDTKDTPKDGK